MRKRILSVLVPALVFSSLTAAWAAPGVRPRVFLSQPQVSNSQVRVNRPFVVRGFVSPRQNDLAAIQVRVETYRFTGSAWVGTGTTPATLTNTYRRYSTGYRANVTLTAPGTYRIRVKYETQGANAVPAYSRYRVIIARR